MSLFDRNYCSECSGTRSIRVGFGVATAYLSCRACVGREFVSPAERRAREYVELANRTAISDDTAELIDAVCDLAKMLGECVDELHQAKRGK